MVWLKKSWGKLTALIGTLFAAWVISQALPTNATLHATAPTANVDGSVLTDLTSIRVYKALITTAAPNCAATGTTYTILTTTAYDVEGGAWTYVDQNLTVTGRHCYKVTALRAGGAESAFSNIAFKDIDVRQPNSPTGLTVN